MSFLIYNYLAQEINCWMSVSAQKLPHESYINMTLTIKNQRWSNGVVVGK